MKSIVLIGVGALGKRHLESILNVEFPMQIYVVEPNENALNEAISLCKNKNQKGKCYGGSSVKILPPQVDLAIIATTSNVRCNVYDELISHSEVDNIIFEKVLFQKIEDYYYVERSLKQNGISAWVNCPRRTYDSYQRLKEMTQTAANMEVHIYGGNWGLACNCIHMLDLIEFLTGSEELEIQGLNLHDNILNSKRADYKEVFGSVSGRCGKCDVFTISCLETNYPLTIEVITPDFICTILEKEKKAIIKTRKNDWKVEIEEFQTYYQSQLTERYVEEILFEKGVCELATYSESMEAHLAFIGPLIEFFEKKGLEKKICPIT